MWSNGYIRKVTAVNTGVNDLRLEKLPVVSQFALEVPTGQTNQHHIDYSYCNTTNILSILNYSQNHHM